MPSFDRQAVPVFPAARPRRHLWAASLVIAAGMSTLLGGCGRTDEAAKALESAGLQLGAVSLGGSSPLPSVDRRKKIYTEVVNTLRAIGTDATQSQSAAAATMQARAHAGLAEISASEAAIGESKFLADAMAARAVLDQWVSMNATADLAGRYDPAKDLADIDRQIAARSQDAQKALADKSAQERVVAQLRAQSADIAKRVAAIRAEESALRDQARTASPQARATFIEQSAGKRREADLLERQSGELLAQASVEAPKIDEQMRLVERLERQKSLLEQAKVDAQTRADAGKQLAARAREEASAAGKFFMDQFFALTSGRAAIEAPTSAALSAYREAIAASKKAASAGRESRGASAVAVGSLQQSLGDVHATRARGLGTQVGLLASASGALPPLSGVDKLKEQLAEARTAFDAATTDATTAYKEALASFQSAGGSGDAKARIEAVTRAMTRLLEEREKLSFDPKAAEEQVRAEFAQIVQLANDGKLDEYAARLKIEDEPTRQLFDAIMPVQRRVAALDAALQDKFGKNFKDVLAEAPAAKGNPILSQLGSGLGMSFGSPDGAKFDVKGPSRAIVTMSSAGSAAGMTPTLEMVRDGDTWKLSPKMPAAMSGMMASLAPLMSGMEKVLAGIAGDVKEGKFADSNEFAAELGKRLMEGMTKLGAPGGDTPKPDAGADAQKKPGG